MQEIDLILERGTEIVAIEVKAAASVGYKDTLALRSLAEDLGSRFKMGIVAYLGDELRVLGEKLALVPVASLLWGGYEISQIIVNRVREFVNLAALVCNMRFSSCHLLNAGSGTSRYRCGVCSLLDATL